MIGLKDIVKLNYKFHLFVSLVLRLALITYGVFHDKNYTVPFTDIDYKVFTDASRHIIDGNPPYDRHTYRYSPLLALLLIPNVIFHPLFGKFLFCAFDICVALLIRVILIRNIEQFYTKPNPPASKDVNGGLETFRKNVVRHRRHGKTVEKKSKLVKTNVLKGTTFIINGSILLWLYNPQIIAISTRGSCDSLAGLLVLITLYLVQSHRCFLAGICHGLSVHFRLYPLAYSLAFYLFFSDHSYFTLEATKDHKDSHAKIRRNTFYKKYVKYLVPNISQIKLVSGFVLSFAFLTILFYYLYGYTFLYETYLYHLVRKDIKHNFSLFFYLQYLTAYIKNIGIWQKVLVTLPQVVLLCAISFHYCLHKVSLNFALLALTMVMVTYNTVLTSQYFVWAMVLFPLCLWQIKFSKATVALVLTFFFAQLAWLMPAYLLEFRGQNTFIYIWIQCIALFCVNVTVLSRLIRNYKPFGAIKV